MEIPAQPEAGPLSDIEDFAYVASHDLKAPLRAIDNLSQWVLEDLGHAASPETAENLGLIRKRVARMNRLLDDLLSYARAGNHPEAAVDIDLSALLRSLQSRLPSRPGIRVELPDGLPSFSGAAGALGQAMSALLSNAIVHHDRPEGLVRVSAAFKGGTVEIAVDDDGPGIEARHQERVFKLGQALKPKDECEGSGVGLALARKIARAHGATLSLSSGPGRGSRFSLAWPLRPPGASGA